MSFTSSPWQPGDKSSQIYTWPLQAETTLLSIHVLASAAPQSRPALSFARSNRLWQKWCRDDSGPQTMEGLENAAFASLGPSHHVLSLATVLERPCGERVWTSAAPTSQRDPSSGQPPGWIKPPERPVSRSAEKQSWAQVGPQSHKQIKWWLF